MQTSVYIKMSMEARMSLLNVSQEYSFCACSLGQNDPLRRNTVSAVARIAQLVWLASCLPHIETHPADVSLDRMLHRDWSNCPV